MVKGVSRRVVVVEPDNRALFEQAIFLVRDHTVSQGEVLREACRIADRYLVAGTVRRPRRRYRLWQVLTAFALGATVSCLIWAAAVFLL